MSLLKRLQQRQPGHPITRILWWHFCHALCVIWFLPFYRFRSYGPKNIPTSGPVIFVSNHQSMLDPIIVGLGSSHRQFYAMARKTLWDTKPLGVMMDTLNAIPVDQANPDASTMKQCIKVLKAGHGLLVFPEGARTYTGKTEAFESGTMLIIKRAKPTVIPVAIEGAFDAWPTRQEAAQVVRTHRLPLRRADPGRGPHRHEARRSDRTPTPNGGESSYRVGRADGLAGDGRRYEQIIADAM